MSKLFSAHIFVKSGSIYVKLIQKWSAATHIIIEYISPTEFLWYLSVIIPESRTSQSQRPP